MRNVPEMMKLLRDIEQSEAGRIALGGQYGAKKIDTELYHQAELLADAGFAEWAGTVHGVIRITSRGHDLANALAQDPEHAKTLTRLVGHGAELKSAAQSVIDATTRAAMAKAR